MGYEGGYTAVTDLLRDIRPSKRTAFERRFALNAAPLQNIVGYC